VDFRILGPLEVVEDGRALQLGGPKQRALLALLLLHADNVVTRDRLIDELWHGEPPAAAETTLRSHISRLRSTLGASRLLSKRPGYSLVLAPEELDSARCERLLAEAREALARGAAAMASDRLRSALALWRGPVLADLAYEPFVQGEIGRLEELRLALVEERIEAALALARHADVIGELEVLVTEHPLRERMRGQLMVALYRSGRQADALESYQQARRLLTDELGLEPSDRLKDLQRAILAHDPSLEPLIRLETDPAQAQAGQVAVPVPFVGRKGELDELVRGLDNASAARGGLFLISGEPGIGKSRLVEQLVQHARESGADVLVGRCWEAGGAPAYWPWVQALRAYVRGRNREVLRDELGRGAADLAQILPELHELYGELPAPPSSDPEGARFRLFEATTSFLVAASLTQPLLLVLDDLHAADAPSLLLLQFLAGALADARLLVIGAYRDADPSLRDPLAETLAELRRHPVTRSLPLVGLPQSDLGSFVSRSTGVEPERELVIALHRATEGNPLFVGELVQLLASEDALESLTDPDAWRRVVPEGVRAVITRRLRHLSENCRLVLVLASVLGREFDLAALECVSELSGDQLLEVLDEAAGERVVADVPGQPGRMRFTHVLIRDSLYDERTPGRRVQLHRLVGDALEKLYADNLDPHLAELAHHFHESARPAEAEKALAYARRAGERAQELLAYEEAARLFSVALRVFDSMHSPDDTVRCELLLALGDAYARAGDTPRSRETYRQAGRLAETLRLPEHLGRAALGYGGVIIWDAARDDEYVRPLLEKALATLGEDDSRLRVRLLARLAGGPLRHATGEAERRRLLGEQALEMARRIGDPSTLAYALEGYSTSHLSPDFTHEQIKLARELIRVALEAGDAERALEGYQFHLETSIEIGDVASAHADLEAMASLADELRQPAQRWVVGVYRTNLALLEGRFADADRLIDETRAIGSRTQRWMAAVAYGLQLYLLRREQGRLKEIEELLLRLALEYPTYPVVRCARANMLAELGPPAKARTELAALATDGFSAIPFDEEWSVSLCFLSEMAVRLGAVDHASALYERLLPFADRVAITYPEISLGAISRFLGILAAATGHWDDSQRHFEDALHLNDRIGARPSLAHTRENYARMLFERGNAGDKQEADKLLAAAVAAYRKCGMESHAARALTVTGPGA
jgi:DNA-binding SARP family transcriptional activator